jgi:hypothetical protein
VTCLAIISFSGRLSSVVSYGVLKFDWCFLMVGSKSCYTLYYPNADSVDKSIQCAQQMKKQAFINGHVTDNIYNNIVKARTEHFCSPYSD